MAIVLGCTVMLTSESNDTQMTTCILCSQLICSYVFMPVAFMMGIPYEESFTVAQLIGTKLFLNEFVAYETLSEMKNNRLNGVLDAKTISVSKCS